MAVPYSTSDVIPDELYTLDENPVLLRSYDVHKTCHIVRRVNSAPTRERPSGNRNFQGARGAPGPPSLPVAPPSISQLVKGNCAFGLAPGPYEEPKGERKLNTCC